jgi:hypothetical protein
MKALLGIAFGAAIIYLALKAADKQPRSVPTLRPLEDADPFKSEPLREEDLKVAQNAPF